MGLCLDPDPSNHNDHKSSWSYTFDTDIDEANELNLSPAVVAAAFAEFTFCWALPLVPCIRRPGICGELEAGLLLPITPPITELLVLVRAKRLVEEICCWYCANCWGSSSRFCLSNSMHRLWYCSLVLFSVTWISWKLLTQFSVWSSFSLIFLIFLAAKSQKNYAFIFDFIVTELLSGLCLEHTLI